MITLYKLQDGELLVVTGHLSKAEIKEYKLLGYRMQNPTVNKHGIPIKGACGYAAKR